MLQCVAARGAALDPRGGPDPLDSHARVRSLVMGLRYALFFFLLQSPDFILIELVVNDGKTIMSHSSEPVIYADEGNQSLGHGKSPSLRQLHRSERNGSATFLNKTYMFGRLCRYCITSACICQALFFSDLKYSISVYFQPLFLHEIQKIIQFSKPKHRPRRLDALTDGV